MNTSNTWRISSEATQNSTLPLSKEGILRSQVLINIRSSTAPGPQQHQVLNSIRSTSYSRHQQGGKFTSGHLASPVSWQSSYRRRKFFDATPASTRYSNSINTMQQHHPYDTTTVSTRCNNIIHNARQHYSHNALTQHCSTHSALTRHCPQCTSSTLHNALARNYHTMH